MMRHNRPVLYRGMKLDWLAAALRDDYLLGHSTQRWWEHDRHHYDDEGEVYDQSYWMKGISCTRDIRFANQWGDCVIMLDREKIAQRCCIMPFNWGKTIRPNEGHVSNHKREREEFIVLERELDRYENPGEPHAARERFKAPARRKLGPLHSILLGIWHLEDHWEPIPEIITSHPMHRGSYRRPGRGRI